MQKKRNIGEIKIKNIRKLRKNSLFIIIAIITTLSTFSYVLNTSKDFNLDINIYESNENFLRTSDVIEFSDTFESNDVDDYPAGWSTLYGGNTIKCVSNPVYQGSRALLIKGGQSWVGKIYNDNVQDISQDFILEIAFYRPTPGLSDENSGEIKYKGIGVEFNYEGGLVKVSASTQSTTGISVNAWHTIKVTYDWLSGLEEVYIDDSYEFSVTVSPCETSSENCGNRVWLASGNDGRGGALREAYYDNVKLTRVGSAPAPPPEIPGYDLFTLLGVLSLTTVVLIKKWYYKNS